MKHLITTIVAFATALVLVPSASAAGTPMHLTAAHGSGTTDQSSAFEVENNDVILIFSHQKTTNSVAPLNVPQITFTAGTWENLGGACSSTTT
jgi:hypothetical protein